MIRITFDKFRLQTGALALALVGTGFLIWEGPGIQREISSRRWPTVEGQIHELVAKTWEGNGNDEPEYYGRVLYTYIVADEQYTTDLTDFGPGPKRLDRKTALADVRHYRVGSKVRVYYDPDDPSVGVLKPGVPDSHQVAILVTGAMAGIGWPLSFLVIRSWIRDWEAVREATEPAPE